MLNLGLPHSSVLALALFAVLFQGGSVPHQHLGAEPGFFNHDHDLSTLATVGGAVVPAGPDPAPDLVVTAAPATPPAAVQARPPRRHADPRAPPPPEPPHSS